MPFQEDAHDFLEEIVCCADGNQRRYNICRYYTIQEHGEKEWILHNEKDFSNYIDYFATVHTLPIKQRMRGPYPASHSREFFGNCDQ